MKLVEITDENRDVVLALRVAPEQAQFVGSVRGALEEVAEYPHANPWYRAVYAGDAAVGFVMLSWNVEPSPPKIIAARVRAEPANLTRTARSSCASCWLREGRRL